MESALDDNFVDESVNLHETETYIIVEVLSFLKMVVIMCKIALLRFVHRLS
jgi:hypothetical protein